MDEEEILPYEDFEADIARSRTGQASVSADSSTSSSPMAVTTTTTTTISTVISITTTTSETTELISSSETGEETQDKKINDEQKTTTKTDINNNDNNNAETSVEAQLESAGMDPNDELVSEEVNESSSKIDDLSTAGVVKLGNISKEPRKSVKPPTLAKAEKTGICYDFQRGVCMRGEVCRWTHTAPLPVSERPFNSAFTVPSLPSTELSEEEKAKRSRRMQKFGVVEAPPEPPTTAPVVIDETVRQNRIKRFGEVELESVASPASIDPDLLAKAKADPVDLAAESRPTVLHICGTWMAKKKTKAILEFFTEYAPSHVEWIDLYSCNVVFKDAASPRRALAGCSHPPDLRTALTEEQHAQAATLNLSEPALHLLVWRLALASRPSAVLLMRLATVKDVKIHPAERKGFTQYLNQHLAPQFPQEAPKLVKVEVKAENLVDDADLKEAIEAKETVDAKGRTIRGRGLKVSGLTRGLGPFIPQEPPPERPVVKKEPQEQPPVKVEGSSNNRLNVQLKGDATRKRAEPANGMKEGKKKLLVTKHGEVFTIRSSPSRAAKHERVAADRSISPQSSNKRPKKIITSRRIQNSRSPSAARSRSAPRVPTRGRLRMDRSRSRSSTPNNKRKTTRAKPDSRSLSPAARPKTVSSRVHKQRSRSRSFSPPNRKVAPRNKTQRSRSRSLTQATNHKTITTRRKAKVSRSRSPGPRSRVKRLPQRSPSRSSSGSISRSPSPPKRKPASSKTLPVKKVAAKNTSAASPKRTVTNKRAFMKRSLSKSVSRSASRSLSNSPSPSRSPSQSGTSRSRSRSASGSSRSRSRSPASRPKSPLPVKKIVTMKPGRNRPPR